MQGGLSYQSEKLEEEIAKGLVSEGDITSEYRFYELMEWGKKYNLNSAQLIEKVRLTYWKLLEQGRIADFRALEKETGVRMPHDQVIKGLAHLVIH